MSASNESLALLRRIAVAVEKMAGISNAAGGGEVADDADLDGKYGDFVVKFHPNRWNGEPMKGRKLSQCPADFLAMLAESFDYFAKKAEEAGEETSGGKPVAQYKRKDAARCRGWAKRIRDGYKPESVDTATGEFTEASSEFTESEWPTVAEMQDSEIPF